MKEEKKGRKKVKSKTRIFPNKYTLLKKKIFKTWLFGTEKNEIFSFFIDYVDRGLEPGLS